ncbi:DNA polymerase III subunit alpha [Sporosarcina sp. HYO08]|uniref:DNA polymerase III subunit alpha n=1 Tax=Sporosarcina sp. HYO08 TaxID=1759557 RepID=UPI00155E1249|nr:DNA polymerase III subunit alpha [Sporosarcina sp. HYO08]
MELVYPQVLTGADLLRSIIKLDQLAPLLQRRGASAVAMVNSKLYGVHSFCRQMTKYGIRPVVGLSVQLEIKKNETVLLYIYAKDDEGFQNLLKMSSAISIRESETLPYHWLKAYSSGCIIVCPLTDHSWVDFRDLQSFQQVKEGVHTNAMTFIGMSRPNGKIHTEEDKIVEIATTTETTIVAVVEARYIDREDAFSYQVAKAIRTGVKLKELESDSIASAHLPTEDELSSWFSDRIEWLHQTANMILSCNAAIPPREVRMPKFPVPEGETSIAVLERNSMEGLNSRLGQVGEQYLERLRYELKIIGEMGFADYFLIVEDFMRFAARSNILTGPGRGSSAGSLVAFALRITDVDPLKYDLLFERFLNPERVTMPDIDIDFADDRRAEVIDYVARKYGKTHVAQIITFGTLSAKSVARNVGRVFDFTNEEMAFMTKEIPDRSSIKIGEVIAQSSVLQKWIAMDPMREQWADAVQKLEGLPRNASTHAAGVILSPIPLVEIVPLQSGAEDIYLTQWPMGEVEERGLLKMDFLGLRNLTLLDRIRKMIFYNEGKYLDFEKIPLNDPKTFELFRAGDMTGVFQFESAGMREALRTIQPTQFEDLFAINALYRPGPMEQIPLYSKRKNHHEKIHYIHPQLEPILAETYGVIVYQEQIMQIAVHFAGYTVAEADLLRRAVSKKHHDLLQQERTHFTESALKNGFPMETAHAVYDLIVKFADYGFPKSHAVAYSLISYRLAYLKANKPAYFYAALLSSIVGNQEKTMEALREIQAKNISILPPSVHKSKYLYTVEKDRIRIGLGTIKGISPTFYNVLKEARQSSGPWKTLFDMAGALGGKIFVEKVVVPLVKAGALDDFEQSRAVLLASIDAAISHALFIRPTEGNDLLTDIISFGAVPKYTPGGTMTRMQMLEFEREVLGFYLSEHPAVEVKKTTDPKAYQDISMIPSMSGGQFVRMIGLVTAIRHIRTKKGEAMAFVTIQDETGQISCTFFPRQYASLSFDLTEMTLLIVEGVVEHRAGKPQIIVHQATAVS